MKTRIALLWAVMVCLLGGCQAKIEYWINPDGSGKVTYEYTQSAVGDEEGLSQLTEYQLAEAKGVAAWSDVKFSFDGSKQHVKATAYFDDINQLQLGGGERVMQPRAIRTDGKIVGIWFDTDIKNMPPETDMLGNPLPNPPPKLTAAQLKARMATLREEVKSWAESQKKASNSADTFEVIFHLPGKPGAMVGMESSGGNEAHLKLSVGKIYEAIAIAGTDEKVLSETAASGGTVYNHTFYPTGMRIILSKLVGDEHGPSTKIVPDAAPLFNYKAELKANQRSYREMAVAAGLVRGSLPVVAEADKMRAVSPGPISRGVRDVNAFIAQAVSQNLVAPRPTGAINVTILPPANSYMLLNTSIILMTDEQDRVVMPGPGAQRWINRSISVSTGDDSTIPTIEDAISLTVQVPASVKAVKRLQGYSTVFMADGVEGVDLGEVDVKAGVKIGKMGIEFTDLTRKRTPGARGTPAATQPAVEETTFGMRASPEWGDKIAGVKLLGPDGHALVTMSSGGNKGGDLGGCAMGPLPERVPMRVYLWKNPRRVDVPFEFEDYSKALAAYNESRACKVPATAPATQPQQK